MKKRVIVPGPGTPETQQRPLPRENPLAVPLPSPRFSNKPRLPMATENSVPETAREAATAPSAPHVTQAPEVPGSHAVIKHSNERVRYDEDSYFETINTRLIDQNRHPPRQLYTEEAIKEIADSIMESKQRDAIHVIPHPTKPGRYIIGDGWTRVQAIRAYDINGGMVRALVHTNLSEDEAAWLGHNQNEQRKGAHDFDRAAFYQGWFDAGMPWTDIAKRLGISEGHIHNYSAFGKLSSDMTNLVKLHPTRFTISNVALFQRLESATSTEVAINFAHRYLAGDYPVRWVTDQVRELIERHTGQAKKRGSSNSVMFQRRYPDGYYRQRRNGKVELSLSIPGPKLEEFNLAIENLLKQYLGEHADETAVPDPGTNNSEAQ